MYFDSKTNCWIKKRCYKVYVEYMMCSSGVDALGAKVLILLDEFLTQGYLGINDDMKEGFFVIKREAKGKHKVPLGETAV